MTSYSRMRARAAEFVRQWSARGGVVILSTDRAAADEVVHQVSGDVLLGVDRYGFREAVRKASRDHLRRAGTVPVGRVVREAVAARVADEASRAGKLTYLNPVAGFPGFPRALAATFEDLRLNRTPASGDLALLLAAYEAEMRARGFADHADRVAAAGAGAARFHGQAVLLLDVAARSVAEREWIAEVKRGAAAVLELHLGPEEGEAEAADCLESLQRNLFTPGAVPLREMDPSVEIFSTSGEALECVDIARRIAHGGIPFDQIGILLRSPERYQPLVLEGLRRAGIPAWCTRGVVRPDAAGRAFLALLACAEEGLSASGFAEYLSLGEADAPAAWERLMVDAAVIGGKDRWERRLAGLRAEALARYAKAEEEDERERLRRRVDGIESLERFALPTIARLADLPREAAWGEWIGALGDLAAEALRDADPIVEMLEQLLPMAEIGPVPLAEVIRVLRTRLGELRVPERDPRYGRVWVGGIEEARGMPFRLVFVPGVNEGLFPRPPAEDPLLPGTSRGDEQELLRIAAACAAERIVLSFSRLDLLTGRERVPSFYAFEAWRAAGGREMDVREFEDRARIATGARIGWPAPADPATAIDDAEFDLATLAARAPGSGLYLKQLPGRAVESLRVRWARWHKAWKPADGLYVDEIGSELMRPYSLRRRAWPLSVLEQYARCPYRFALRGIHGLRETERPGAIQRMDAATRGLIFHETQAELLRGPDPLERLDEVLARIAAAYEEKLAPAIPQIWRVEIAAIRADLRGWLEIRASRDVDWTVVDCEREFDTEVEGFRIKGRIDLIERHASGALRVVDHKTGKPREPRPEMVGGGEVLQPALYGLAAAQELGERVGMGRLWYATNARNYETVDVPLNEWARRRALTVLERIDTAIVGGFLPAAPGKDGCKGCEYTVVCGPYEAERVAAKSQVELSALREMRGWR